MPILSPFRRWLALIVVAGCCQLIYLLYFVRQFPLLRYYGEDIDMGGITNRSHAAFWSFVGFFVLLFLLLAVAVWLVSGLEDHDALPLALVAGATFFATMTLVYPITAVDIYTYIDQSLVLVQYHQNPIFVTPSHFPSDPLMHLSASWSGKGAPYGPFGILIDALPTAVLGRNLLATLIALKVTFSAIALLDAYLVYRILRRAQSRYAVAGALLVAWNPLVLFETAANGHNDAAMLMLALLGLLALAYDRLTLGLVLIGISALVKYATLLLLPLAIAFVVGRCLSWRGRSRNVGVAVALIALVAAAAYAPFWRGPATFDRSLLENSLYVESFSSVLPAVVPGVVPVDVAAMIGRLLFLPAYAYALWTAGKGLVQLLEACLLATLSFLGLAVTNFKIWYAMWPAVLAAAVPSSAARAAALCFACCATITAALYGFEWWWLGLGNPTSFVTVNKQAYLLTFAPALCLWLLLRSFVVPGTADRPAPSTISALGQPVQADERDTSASGQPADPQDGAAEDRPRRPEHGRTRSRP